MPDSGMVSKWIDMRDLFCENPCVFLYVFFGSLKFVIYIGL